jgi:hypothetical protein
MRHPSQDWAMPGDTTLFQESVKNCGNFTGIGAMVVRFDAACATPSTCQQKELWNASA